MTRTTRTTTRTTRTTTEPVRTARHRLQGLATALLLASHALGATASAASGSSVGDRGRPRLGSGFPNVELVRHDGAVVRFQDDLVEDRVFVLNFMYTTCADVCPLETARLSEVQAILGDRIGRDVFMYSITIDPERDTPEVLAAYRERFGVEPGWGFYTGRAEDLLALRRALGLYFDDLEDEYDHNISLVIGNGETGHLIRRTPFDNPYALATQITSSIRDHGEQGVGVASYAEAPVQLPRLHAGARLFQSKCSVCHALGEEDGQLRIGPNLGGVTGVREPEWLLRWILEPDEVLAEGDPTARALFEAYNEVPMPDLGLSEEEAYREVMRQQKQATSASPEAADARRAAMAFGAMPSGEAGVSGGGVLNEELLRKFAEEARAARVWFREEAPE